MPKPSSCLANYAPVCGCDGESYLNGCLAAQADAGILHDGSCDFPEVTLASRKVSTSRGTGIDYSFDAIEGARVGMDVQYWHVNRSDDQRGFDAVGTDASGAERVRISSLAHTVRGELFQELRVSVSRTFQFTAKIEQGKLVFADDYGTEAVVVLRAFASDFGTAGIDPLPGVWDWVGCGLGIAVGSGACGGSGGLLCPGAAVGAICACLYACSTSPLDCETC